MQLLGERHLVTLTGTGGTGKTRLVLRTAAGSAGAVTAALDQAGWDGVIGTIAGDDTVLVITRSDKLRKVVAERVRQLTSG